MASTLRARIELDGATEVASQLKQLQAIFTDTGTAIEAVGASFSNIVRNVEMAVAAFVAVEAAVVSVTAVFSKLGKEAADTIDEIGDAAEAVGLTVEEFQKLSGAAEAAGMAGKSIERTFRKISIDMEEAENKTGKFADRLKKTKDGIENLGNKDPYKKWGISLTDGMTGRAKAFEQVVKDIADAYSKLDASARPEMLKDLGFKAKDAAEFAQLIQLGADGLENFAKQAEKLKYVPTDKDNEIVARSIAAASLLKDAWQKFKIEVGKAFIPLSTEVDKGLATLIDNITAPLAKLTTYIASRAKPVIQDFFTMINGGGRFNNIQFAVWQVQIEEGLIRFQGYYEKYIGPFIDGFVSGVQSGLGFIVSAFTMALDAVSAVLAPIGAILQPIRDALASLITPEGMGKVAGFAATIMFVLMPALSAISPVITLIISSIGLLTAALGPGGLLFAAVAGLTFYIGMNWDTISAKTTEVFNYLAGIVSQGLTSAGQAAMAGLDAIAGYFTNAFTTIQTTLQGFFDWISNAISNALSALSSLASQAMGAVSGGGGATFASGGYVSGAGTGTSDSIPAWLSNGEFVIKAAAVRKIGLGLLHRLNNGFTPPSLSGGRLAYAAGGLVGSMSGGGGRSFNLVIDGRTFGGLTGGADTISSLEKYAASRQLSATSKRSPSRIG